DAKRYLLEVHTRRIPLPRGGTGQLTHTGPVRRALEHRSHRGCLTIERPVQLANVDGCPPKAPFELRCSTVIAYWTRRNRDEWGDYADYCLGRISRLFLIARDRHPDPVRWLRATGAAAAARTPPLDHRYGALPEHPSPVRASSTDQ